MAKIFTAFPAENEYTVRTGFAVHHVNNGIVSFRVTPRRSRSTSFSVLAAMTPFRQSWKASQLDPRHVHHVYTHVNLQLGLFLSL